MAEAKTINQTPAADVYLALVHHPVYNKLGDEITTTITNLDLHDISRAGRTYDVRRYFVVNQLKSQQALVHRMQKYWTGGKGAEYNTTRHEAFSVLEVVDTLEDAAKEIKEETGREPVLVTTSAKSYKDIDPVSFKELRSQLIESDRPYLIIFGTGWGLSHRVLDQCDLLLAPVNGRGDYNHLSVRSAASIILDRLLASPWWE
ncbi:MAG: RNA methyltransferase [Bacillota bacterium]